MAGKRATDHLEPAAKKRGSERQLTKDDESEEEEQVEAGNFARASEDVIKKRKIIRARRGAGGAEPSGAAGSNPFANIQLASGAAAPAVPAANPFAGIALAFPKPAAAIEPPAAAEEAAKQPENGKEKAEEAEAKPAAAFGGGFGASIGGFGSIASGATAPAFTFGAAPKAEAGEAAAPAAPPAASAVPSVFGAATASGTPLFGAAAAKPPPAAAFSAEKQQTTGEESEKTVFSGSGILFEFDAAKTWRERGRGELRVNSDLKTSQARLVMRQKGNLRLLLNANLWPEMQVTKMEGNSGVTFACVNHLGEGAVGSPGAPDEDSGAKLATYALRMKPAEALERFAEAVEEQKKLSGKAECNPAE